MASRSPGGAPGLFALADGVAVGPAGHIDMAGTWSLHVEKRSLSTY